MGNLNQEIEKIVNILQKGKKYIEFVLYANMRR